MSSNNDMGTIGTDEPVAREIRRFFPEYPESTVRQALSDPTPALLAALLRQGEGFDAPDYELDPEETTADYYAEQYTVTATGPEIGGAEPSNVNGAKIDLGDTYEAFDLRFTDEIDVAFQGTNNEHRTITYRAEDSPVVGKEATTRYIWVTRGDNATANPDLWMEAY